MEQIREIARQKLQAYNEITPDTLSACHPLRLGFQLGDLAILSATVSWITCNYRFSQFGCFESVVHVPSPSTFPLG